MNGRAYRARWAGADHEASPDLIDGVLWMRLYGPAPGDGFERVTDGRFVRAVPAADCSAIWHVTTVCEWRGAPFLVHRAREAELLVEYLGADAVRAAALGLERVERGVYRLWVRRAEVTALREQAVPLVNR
ncbi:hypothetical protein FAF44_04975 [Nonomuraea sp. MG754425]|uniref:hypothetical protein n=1 Tax=Nonomuraea sp. MG754425 TaxID=2570319 RepID=UPI001F2508B6|nr:hypothetical protein [Nonomuraea sp. MG754425]MCF6467764.1 hypothetical protein [Nonomuraea sp. MG754425]